MFDLAVALVCTCLFAVPAALIAIAIKVESRGPILIATKRVGKGGRVFSHYRFRTMSGSPLRKTRLGRFIGNLSLDDIPTLMNVWRGDLSIIGPKPEAPENVDLTSPNWQRVLSVRPGLSGLGLLTYLADYNKTAVSERIKPEVYYVEHQSLRFDTLLLFRTFRAWLRMGHLKGKF